MNRLKEDLQGKSQEVLMENFKEVFRVIFLRSRVVLFLVINCVLTAIFMTGFFTFGGSGAVGTAATAGADA